MHELFLLYGSLQKRSDFYNIYGVAEVDEETCIGCGLCAKACPQEIIHVHPTDNPFVVKCSNREKAQLQKGLRGKLHRLRSLREKLPCRCAEPEGQCGSHG